MVKRTITITTILLILTMVVSLIVVLNKASFAADDDIASGTSGSCTWVIDSEGVLTISPTDGVSGQLASYSGEPQWCDYNSSINKVVVNGDVKTNSGCVSLFRNLTNCTEMNLETLDTSNATNMKSMFNYCQKLTSLDISNFDTSKVTDMSYMFYACTKLAVADVSNFNTSKVTNMSCMFCFCENLPVIDVSGFDTSKVTTMYRMFCMCNKVESLDVSNFVTNKVTNMEYMFLQCYKITEIDVSNFDTSNVTTMANMFCDCINLTHIEVSNFNTEKVTTMFAMFDGCKSLKTLDLSSFNTNRVTNMVRMFEDLNLTYLDISNFDTSNTDLMLSMFNNSRIESIKFGKDFKFKGNNIENSEYQANIPKPSTSYPYTGKWIREDGLFGPYSSDEMKDNYVGEEMLGIWIWDTTTVQNYTVSYEYTGLVPEGASDLPEDEEYEVGSNVVVCEDATAPGYTFSGWNYSNFIMPSYDVIITGSFSANRNTPYKVEHYLEDSTPGTYTLTETENLTGTTDSTKKATPKTFSGYRFDSGVEGTIQQGKIVGDGSLVLKLYYKKDVGPSEQEHKYTINYYFDGVLDETLNQIINAEINSEVNITPITPIKHGNKNYTLISNNHQIIISVNDEDNIIRVYYETDVLDYAIDGDEDEIEGDGISDKYQIRIIYKVQNGSWNDGTRETKVNVITLYDKNGNPTEEGTGTTQIPEVGSKPNKGYTYGYWNKNIPSKVTNKDNGKEYVYSYETVKTIEADIARGKGKASNPKTDDVMNRYLLAGVGGIFALMLVSRIRRRYSRKARKIQF